MLVVPAAIALVLGGVRVQQQLDDANALSTVRDQLTVLDESVTLGDLVALEMVAPGLDLDERKAAVDKQATEVQKAADFAHLPAGISRKLDDALDQLRVARQQAADPATDPVTEAFGYREVIRGLGELLPHVVAAAADPELDDRAETLLSLLLLRAAVSTEEALIQSAGGAPVTSDVATAAQHNAAEESVLGDRLALDMPAADLPRFSEATASGPARRDALQASIGANRTAELANLLPDLQDESSALRSMTEDKFAELAGIVSTSANNARASALRDSSFVLGALLAALAIALLVARSLLVPVRRLRVAALAAAHDQLPRTVEKVRAGEHIDYRSIEPVPVHTNEEIGQLARAFDDMHTQAVKLAGEQAELRHQVSEMFMTLSRRSQSLVELQLGVIEELETDEQDPKRLDGLFRLDHLATRLRRNGENLQVLAGGTPPRRGNQPVTVVELLRAATSEVKDYRRVSLGHAPNGSVRSSAAADIVHILAELLENATRFSPPDRKVVLTADRGADGGLLFEVVDAGLGMAADDIGTANRRLATTDEVDPETTRRMGLFVVSQLAARHGVTVRLRPTYDSSSQAGITASVHVPSTFVLADGVPESPVEAPQNPAAVATVASVDESTDDERVVRTYATASVTTVVVPPIPVATNGSAIGWFTPVVEVEGPAPLPSAPNDTGWLTRIPPTIPPTTVPASAPAGTAPKGAPASAPRSAPKPAPQVDSSVGEQTIRTTTAGLPLRMPGGNTAPAKLTTQQPTTQQPVARQSTGLHRDPESIRSNLSRHYSGMQAARRTRQESESTAAPERQN
ncbi:ATP-binding protein [Actinophytocola sp.]|uniref:sensor histidine kinase n=1 Tax=Actinophytocola sp. TaxID=1872138 RepID=UPI0025C6C847|nr:ATP-binding protein [Actinophytocola sp.]